MKERKSEKKSKSLCDVDIQITHRIPAHIHVTLRVGPNV